EAGPRRGEIQELAAALEVDLEVAVASERFQAITETIGEFRESLHLRPRRPAAVVAPRLDVPMLSQRMRPLDADVRVREAFARVTVWARLEADGHFQVDAAESGQHGEAEVVA